MKVGDLVKLKNLHPEWGTIALITGIRTNDQGLGQVYLLANGTKRAVPWLGRTKYLEAINESR
jgi:hypothetical protein